MPDGKQIEVVYRDHAAAPADPPRCDRPGSAARLLRLRRRARLPARLGRRGRPALAHRDALSRCEARREGVFGQAFVERLDEELDRAAGALLSDLKQITHANMADEIEFFVRALDAT